MRILPAILLLLLPAAPALGMPFPIDAAAPKEKPGAGPVPVAPPPVVGTSDTQGLPKDAEEFVLWRTQAKERSARIRMERRMQRALALVEDRTMLREEAEEKLSTRGTKEGSPGISPLLLAFAAIFLLLTYKLSRYYFSGAPAKRPARRPRTARA